MVHTFPAFIKNVKTLIVGKLWFIPLAEKIFKHLCYWLYGNIYGRFFKY